MNYKHLKNKNIQIDKKTENLKLLDSLKFAVQVRSFKTDKGWIDRDFKHHPESICKRNEVNKPWLDLIASLQKVKWIRAGELFEKPKVFSDTFEP